MLLLFGCYAFALLVLVATSECGDTLGERWQNYRLTSVPIPAPPASEFLGVPWTRAGGSGWTATEALYGTAQTPEELRT